MGLLGQSCANALIGVSVAATAVHNKRCVNCLFEMPDMLLLNL